jgi:hypothetical protein
MTRCTEAYLSCRKICLSTAMNHCLDADVRGILPQDGGLGNRPLFSGLYIGAKRRGT